ncbi:MAG: bacteriophage abortive infection AbiH family protein [Bacteroidota bacterium]
MVIKKLYIIGNGFDLHHNLRTSYYDFAKFLKKKNKDLYITLEKYISYPSFDRDLWSRFEENLANLEIKEIIYEHADTLPSYGSDDFRDRDRYVFPDIMHEHYQKLTSGLFSEFEAFIKNVDFHETAFEYNVKLDKSATFLTFNYTNTLEHLYKIDKKQIVYIHNSVFYNSEGIVLGHGIDPENFKEKRQIPPDGLNEEQLEDWNDQHNDYDYSYDTGKETLMRYFKDTYKPTKDIIKEHSAFFKSIINVEEVYILGHSISPVDLPYFQQIIRSVRKDVKWHVSYYDIKESKKHFGTLKALGIEENNIILFKLVDIKENNKQFKMDLN